ncbi:MAG: carboxypeptidase-like regulatory domain-containing protein, partial [Planctomycetota bacterium]
MNKLVKTLIVAALLACVFIGAIFFLFDEEDAGSGRNGVVKQVAVVEKVEEPPNVVPIQEKVQEFIPVAGSVKDVNGVAVAGTRILAYPVLAGGSVTGSSAIEQQVAAQDGRFAFAKLESGHYRFVARKTGFAEGRLEAVLVKGQAPSPLDFQLKAGLGISGYVRDFAGKGIAGARVQAYGERVSEDADIITGLMALTKLTERNPAEDEPSHEALSDAQGYYQVLDLEQTGYRLRVAAATFAPAERRHVPSPSNEVNFTLQVGGVLSGLVVDQAGAPVAGARIDVYTQPDTDSPVLEVVLSKALPPLATRETNEAGEFVFDELGGGGKYQLFASAAGFVETSLENVVVVPSTTT